MKQILATLLALLIASSCWAAGEVVATAETGQTLYFIVKQGSNAWNLTLAPDQLATYSTTRGDFDIAMTETASTGSFVGDFPALSAGNFIIEVYQDANDDSSPSHTDDLLLARGEKYWNGSAFGAVAAVTELSGAAARPAWLRKVPGSRTITVGTARDSGEAEVSGSIRMKAGEGPLAWLIDFDRTQVATGDFLDDAETPTVTGADAANCTINSTEGTGWAIYGSGTGVVVLPAIGVGAQTDDVINVVLEVSPEPSESKTVTIPVEVYE